MCRNDWSCYDDHHILHRQHLRGSSQPAVTISFAAIKHIPWKNVPLYIGAQVLASVSAAFALKLIFHPFMSGGVTVPSVGYGQAFVAEFSVSFTLMFVVTAVANGTRAVRLFAGIVVGATVMINIHMAGYIYVPSYYSNMLIARGQGYP
ncbi:hypothetical protein GLYMA_07G026900v4 [Glycine max]|nr:hypothetical protein GLYMA_07G026900v4 [Glycine max]KAH1085070.1 hypothetical protein GYH30_017210 [Glycine max]